jgi:hypothetical protein
VLPAAPVLLVPPAAAVVAPTTNRPLLLVLLAGALPSVGGRVERASSAAAAATMAAALAAVDAAAAAPSPPGLLTAVLLEVLASILPITVLPLLRPWPYCCGLAARWPGAGLLLRLWGGVPLTDPCLLLLLLGTPDAPLLRAMVLLLLRAPEWRC